MRTIAIIGCGAIAEAVSQHLQNDEHVSIGLAIIEPGTEARARDVFGKELQIVHDISQSTCKIDLAVDCAGHGALRQHGPAILEQGIDLISVSSGALADPQLSEDLATAARAGGAALRIVSGAIGALDALSAAGIGTLTKVIYRGRKPPQGWLGSAAEEKLDLDSLCTPTVHFSGNARDAARLYPKNANVAASVALAGVGFEATAVELIADPSINENYHEVEAEGEFGRLKFQINGNALPGNPRSSTLTAMSVVREILAHGRPIGTLQQIIT